MKNLIKLSPIIIPIIIMVVIFKKDISSLFSSNKVSDLCLKHDFEIGSENYIHCKDMVREDSFHNECINETFKSAVNENIGSWKLFEEFFFKSETRSIKACNSELLKERVYHLNKYCIKEVGNPLSFAKENNGEIKATQNQNFIHVIQWLEENHDCINLKRDNYCKETNISNDNCIKFASSIVKGKIFTKSFL